MTSDSTSLSDNSQDPLQMTGDTGISEEDKEDVLRKLDEIVSENKITVTEELFELKEVKSGMTFPVMVPVLSLIFIVVIVLVLGFLFQGDEQTLIESSLEFSSVEGQLIRELRQESQEQISARDREILEIEQRLLELEEQRQELSESIEIRIADREAFYAEKIFTEVEAEKRRLEALGVNASELERLLDLYEQERRTFYETQLENYRQELEEERIEIEANINALRTEYQNQIADLRQEKQTLLDDFRAQEVNLRSQLEQRTRVLEDARTVAVENLESARAELARLERAQEEIDTIENQMLGFYGRLQGALDRSAWGEATDILNQATSFLDQETVVASNALTARRDVDLFILSTLQSYIDSEQRDDIDFESISQQLEILSKIRLNDQRASSALGSNDPNSANAFYAESLTLMPELTIAHEALVEDARQQLESQFEQELFERTRELTGQISQAIAQINRGNYAEALAAYDEALQLLPELTDTNQQITSGLIEMGYSVAELVVLGQNSGAFNPVIERARANTEVILSGVSNQVQSAVEERETELYAQLAENDDAAELIRTELNEKIASLEAVGEEQSNRINELSQQRRDLQQQTRELTAEVENLETFKELLDTVENQYAQYVNSTEESVSSANSELEAARAARQELELFIGSNELNGIFPSFVDRVRDALTRAEEAGQSDVYDEILDFLITYLEYDNSTQRIRYRDSEESYYRSEGNDAFADFIIQFAELNP